MAKHLKAPTIQDLLREAVEVQALVGEWTCPVCKQLCYYNSIPNPKIEALQETADAKKRFRNAEHYAMLEAFLQTIEDHLAMHELERGLN